MCLRPPTPRSLTEPVSFGVIDPSRRVSRAELDRQDRLWREKHHRNGTTMHAISSGSPPSNAARASIESDMTRVEGREYGRADAVASERGAPQTARNRGQSVKTWLMARRASATANTWYVGQATLARRARELMCTCPADVAAAAARPFAHMYHSTVFLACPLAYFIAAFTAALSTSSWEQLREVLHLPNPRALTGADDDNLLLAKVHDPAACLRVSGWPPSAPCRAHL